MMHVLLCALAENVGIDATALRRSAPALAQRLDCLAEGAQDAVRASCAFWEELSAVLAAQRDARPARAWVVRRSQCLHCGHWKLLVKAARAGLVCRVVSRERRALFSGVVELAGIVGADGLARDLSAALRPPATQSCEDFDNNAG